MRICVEEYEKLKAEIAKLEKSLAHQVRETARLELALGKSRLRKRI